MPTPPADVDNQRYYSSGEASSNGEGDDRSQLPARIVVILAESHELRGEIERLRTERSRLMDLQSRMMELIGCKSPDRLVHDIRNVLNQCELYRALADATQS